MPRKLGQPSPKLETAQANFDHEAWLADAIVDLKVNPYELIWHYLWAALLRHGTLSDAARITSTPRRTVQRILSTRRPLPSPPEGR